MSIDPVAGKRSMLIYAICLPVAFILGLLLVNIGNDPSGSQLSEAVVGLALLLMMLPLLLRWYHPWLIAIWNSSLMFTFLPGKLQGWTVLAIIGFGIAIGHYILNRQRKFLSAPSVSYSLIFIAIVVAVTAEFRGGIGLLAFGNEAIGGKRYILIWVTIMGYFAITSQAIAPNKRKLMMVLFILGGVTQVISDVAGLAGGPLSFLSVFFPLTDSSMSYLRENPVAGPQAIERFGGLANGGLSIAFSLLAYFGIEALFNLRKPWRIAIFAAALFLSTYGGFRTMAIFAIMVLAFVFYFEGMLRSRLLPAMMLGFLLLCGVTLAVSEHLPLQFQRSIAFLPWVKLDQTAMDSAEATREWRLEIWRSVVPQVPHYLLLGKGLGIDLNDLASYYKFGNDQVGGEVGGGFTVSGDYHNGPLSLTMEFGIWGIIGFLWFLLASLKVLWANYKYGDPDIKRLNTFLLAYFIAKIIMFFFVFGGFYSDITVFAGAVAFSISLNGGVAKPAPVVRPKIVFNRFRPLPAPAAS